MSTPRIRMCCKSRSRSKFNATGLQSNDVSSNTTTSMAAATTAGDKRGRPSLSAAAKSMQKKRALMKEDKDVWALHKAVEAKCQCERRKNRTDVQKKRDKESGKIRSREYYLKMKERGSLPEKQKKRLTRAEQKIVRDYNRERQREWRKNQTEQKKAWIRKKKSREQERKDRCGQAEKNREMVEQVRQSPLKLVIKRKERRGLHSQGCGVVFQKIPKSLQRLYPGLLLPIDLLQGRRMP